MIAISEMTVMPPVRQRVVGAALRRYRQESGLEMDDAARVLECDKSKISRIETGHRGIRRKELRELLAEYGADDKAQETLTMIAAPRAAHGRWNSWSGSLPEIDIDLMVLEAAASQIQIYQAQQVPALLQTESYTHSIARPDISQYSAVASKCLAERQQLILAIMRPSVTAVIAETALQQGTCGREVMRDQLAALATAEEQYPHLRIWMLPSAFQAHAASAGSFTILRYPAADLAVVHLPALSSGTFLTSQHDLAIYSKAFAQLQADAERLIRESRHPL